VATRKKAVKKAARRPKRRVRRTHAQLFMDSLAELSGDAPRLISNPTLRAELEWDAERYTRIKSQLVSEGRIIVGRGYGGSVALAAGQGQQALSIFVSYSHADEKYKDALLKHLRPLERMNLVTQWHDRKLLAGDAWGDEISKHLEQADIVLLLVSVEFINSKYCYDVELERALERHSRGECRVVPVIIRGCLWQHTPFARLQALPRDGKPVSSWPDLDDVLASIAEAIRSVAEDVIASR
jgi:hypothetical protein